MNKTSLALLIHAAILLSSCSKGHINPTKSRIELQRYPHPKEMAEEPEDPGPAPAGTALFYSTVDFANSYDWQRDTAYGTAPFTLRLHSQSGVMLELHSADNPGLFSPSPETHHIIDGHLYTERQDIGGTVICKDGKPAVRINAREFLKGLVEKDGHIYTLSQECFSDACLYRDNGETVTKFREASVFGSFTDPTYPQTGALYISGGKIYFSYTARNKYYAVRDGESEEIKAGTYKYVDIKAYNGGYATLPAVREGLTIEKGGLYAGVKGYDACGIFRSGSRTFSGVIQGSRVTEIFAGEAVVYPSSSGAVAVSGLTGRITLWSQDGKMILEEGGRFLSPSCAAVFKGDYALAVAPVKEGKAILVTNKERKELEINGYVSCVNLTPPMK